MTVKTARIHIGPHKTGSTSIQTMLHNGRSRMATAGYLYPDAPNGGTSQFESVYDFTAAAVHPPPPLGADLAALVARAHRRWPGSFRRMLADIAAHDGDVVISVEFLSVLTPELAGEFVNHLAVDRVEVVLVRRPPSQLLASWYAETIKRTTLPDLAPFTRQVFADLAARRPNQFTSIDPRNLVRAWGGTGADVIEIDATAGLTDAVVEQTGEVLTPGLRWTALPEPANVGMSAIGVHLWRTHFAAHRPAYVASAHAVRERMLATFPETSSGPKPRLSAAAAAALDAYCAGTTAHLVVPDELVEPLPATTLDLPAALARMARWQRQADRRWRMLDVASRLARRGPLQPGLA